jgi:hypothetical protein
MLSDDMLPHVGCSPRNLVGTVSPITAEVMWNMHLKDVALKRLQVMKLCTAL